MAVAPFVVGRDGELAAVGAFLASAEALPSVLLLEGEAGMGKTTLWEHALAKAAPRFRVLSARPVEIESRLTFAAVHDLLEPALDEVQVQLPPPQLAALEAALLIGEADRGPPEPHAIAFAFLSSLRAVAETGQVLVAVDDLQWLDPSSAAVLVFAVRRAGPEIRFLLARRSGEQAVDVTQGIDTARVRRMPVGPLSRGAVQRLLRDRLAFTPSRPSLTRIHRVSGGNPFYALELARAHASGADETEIPPTLAALVDERLGELPTETERALQVAALFARPTVGALTSVLGAEPELEPAVRLGVIRTGAGSVEFTHPLLASSLAARIEPGAARAIHGRIADVVDGLEERARHLALAADGPDAAAAAALEEAAAQASGRGAPDVAADLLDQALRLTAADDPGLVPRLLLAADAHRDSGDFARSRELAESAVDRLPPGESRARALVALAAASSEPLDTVQQALAEAGSDHALRAQINMSLALAHLIVDCRRSLADARAAVAAAEADGDPALGAEAFAMRAWFEGASGEGDPLQSLARAKELECLASEAVIGFRPAFAEATVRMWRDDHDLARAGFVDDLDAAEQRGDAFQRMHALIHLAQVEWRAGNWNRAAGHAEAAWDEWQDSGDSQGIGAVLWIRSVVAAHQGLLGSALEWIDEALTVAPDDRLYLPRHEWVRGFVALCEDDPETARVHLAAAAQGFAGLHIQEPGMRLFASDLIEALVATGRLAEAEAEVDELVRLGAELRRPRALAIGARGRGLIHAGRGEIEAAIVALTGALDVASDFPVPFEQARTLLALGAVQRRARRRREARETLGSALELFETLGARVFAERARAELGRIGGRAPTSGELTAAERRVAELVAQGRTNKEVAGDLVVSVHTVEAALTQVYRKLGLRSRAELALRFPELEPSKE